MTEIEQIVDEIFNTLVGDVKNFKPKLSGKTIKLPDTAPDEKILNTIFEVPEEKEVKEEIIIPKISKNALNILKNLGKKS